MIDECDEMHDDEWPNDDEANDIMLAYEATGDLRDSRSGCAGVVLVMTLITFSLFWVLVR
jgi:hypothetical protein